MPYISVVMPAYNAERTIRDSIESVLRQTYSDFELIVINDCSKDGTAAIVEEYCKKDPRVVFLNNPVNSGVAATRNYGVSEATGEWIAFLDSDDMWKDDKLEKQLKVLKEHPEVVLSYTASQFIDESGSPFRYVLGAEEQTTYRTILRKNLISCSSVMIRADVMKSIRMPNDRMHEDYYVWLTVLKKEEYAYGLNEPLLIYRLSANSKSGNRIKSAKMLWRTYRAVGYGSVVSTLLMLRYSVYSINKRYNIKKNG